MLVKLLKCGNIQIIDGFLFGLSRFAVFDIAPTKRTDVRKEKRGREGRPEGQIVFLKGATPLKEL